MYNIKSCAIWDQNLCSTAYVLKVIVYTGKHTYNEPVNQADKKTICVVKELCKSWEGTHCTVYVDRFYTLLELSKELHKMKLYVTGTILKNWIPLEVTIAKSSWMFKEMNGGNFKRHRYSYMENGKGDVLDWCVGEIRILFIAFQDKCV